MTKLSIPQNTHDILEIVRNGINQNSSIEIIGAGTKRSWGRDTKTSVMVDLSNIAGITPAVLIFKGRCENPGANSSRTLANSSRIRRNDS